MARLPRDVSGAELVARLSSLGYRPTRQKGSHVRLTRVADEREHHVTIPLHDQLKVGTLNGILRQVATATGMTKAALIRHLWGPT